MALINAEVHKWLLEPCFNQKIAEPMNMQHKSVSFVLVQDEAVFLARPSYL